METREAIAQFNTDGLVTEVRDYWHVQDGHAEPQGELFITARLGNAVC